MQYPRPILTGRQYGWITLAFVAFVIYGSLVPLTFRAITFGLAWERFRFAFSKPVAMDLPSDWLANVLLFIPLGFIALGWRCVDRPGRCLWAALVILAACALLSALLEFTQEWFPDRHTSINDVVAETLGGAIGIAIWLLAGERITSHLRRFWADHAANNWSIRLIPGYLLLLVIIHGMPFDLTLSPGFLMAKYRHPNRLIRPIPFTVVGDESFDLVRKGLINTAWFLPAGVLLAGLPGTAWRRPGAAWRVWGIGVALAGTIELMQLFPITRYCDTTDIVTGSLAVLAGWRIRRAGQESGEIPGSFPAGLRVLLLLAWVAALIFFHWEPFNFQFDRTFVSQRWEHFSFVSCVDKPQAGRLHLFNDMIQKMLLFLPLGLFLASSEATGRRRAVAVAVACLMSGALEIGQFFLPHHQRPGLSDLIVEPFGAWLGCLAMGRFHVLKKNMVSESTSTDMPRPEAEQEGSPP